MNDLIEIFDSPPAEPQCLIAGWHQWADAGTVSSGLPRYLVRRSHARRVGQIKPDTFYLFQIPGSHHLLRPVVKLNEGYTQELREKKNEFFYAGDDQKGYLVFLGEEPHQNEDQYAQAFLDAAEALGVKKVAIVASVYGPVPYDREREISCVYSLPGMREDLVRYAMRFSDYEGGATIGVYLADRAEQRGIELLDLYAIVPAYEFSQLSLHPQSMRIERDFKAWHDIMRRLDHLFGLEIDLSDLQRRSEELVSSMDEKVQELEKTAPELHVREYLEKLTRDFTEMPFMPLDVWERGLGDLLEGMGG